MRHIGKVTKAPAAATIEGSNYAQQYSGYGIFGLGPAFWAGVLGYPFQEVGDLVMKWNAKISGVITPAA